jgi:hypothetical protein
MPDPNASKRMKYVWKLIKEEKMTKSQAFAKAYDKYPVKKAKKVS